MQRTKILINKTVSSKRKMFLYPEMRSHYEKKKIKLIFVNMILHHYILYIV